MKKKLLFITGSRGEWGYIRPILRLCQKRSDFDYSICATNMHLLPNYGSSFREIENDGFKINHKIFMSLDGNNHLTMVKSLGIFLMSLADILAAAKPDWIILAGDRGEQLMGAICGAFCYIPVAHIQAGELSGNIDGMTRHAIGKYAHLHFASSSDASNRLIKLGEESFRVHNVGAPQLDELVEGNYSSKEELENRLAIDLSQPYVLMAQHPVTEEAAKASDQIKITMEALKSCKLTKIIVYPNNDAGSEFIREGIENLRHGKVYLYSNLKREDYLGLMKNAACMIGNSSSGLIEAPIFKIPSINIGRRQSQRLRGSNVIDVEFNKEAIEEAIKMALSEEFCSAIKQSCISPYGDGHSSERILRVLSETIINEQLVVKNLTY